MHASCTLLYVAIVHTTEWETGDCKYCLAAPFVYNYEDLEILYGYCRAIHFILWT